MILHIVQILPTSIKFLKLFANPRAPASLTLKGNYKLLTL